VGSNVQNPDITPDFRKSVQTGAEKEDLSRETGTYGNPKIA